MIVDVEGSDDRIIFTRDMDGYRDSLDFLLESDGDLVIGYGDEGSKITIKHQEQLESIERIEMSNSCYLDSNDIDKIIQTLSAYSGADALDIGEVNTMNSDNTIGQITWSEG